ncbi:hypothetical protein PTH_2029 [Pelotomaculum thermopropionicum SI]|uniref:Uncharacterized protein n=1 Tax=Pelotomaculum thermopropionicum (strain DSM 13744 / JCM 10971 / SI) TaxID=370438 RepID=A5D0K5_PELTS|nr:hypothetical protein PTH_2029 [Pelotomaculum thermopropionicum SI]
MEYPSNAPQILYALKANMAAQIRWLKSCQILCPGNGADGAITRYPDQGWVTPYFSNFAALALLEEPSCLPLAERYLDWYLRNIEKNGTILDYHYGQNLSPKTARPDSEDAYAGTFLSLAAAYHKKSAQTGWAEKNISGLKKVARSVVNLMDRDGLTFALAGYRVKYLMDNCEAYRGLADFAELLESLGDEEAAYFKARAKAIAGGVERVLWNRRGGYYHPSKYGWSRAAVDMRKFYPDAACQVFPALYGLIEPGSERGMQLYKKFNEYQPDWIAIKPPDYPWVILGYCACLHGDYSQAYEKIRMVRETYIDTGSGNWFCAEAAFFVLTCARLIQNSEHWLGIK